MQPTLFESSLSKFLTILLIPTISAIILNSYFNMASGMINFSMILLGIWYLIFVPRFLRIFSNDNSLILSMPLNPFYRKKTILLKDVLYLEIINFKGPFMKVGLLNGDTTVVVFIPSKKEILQSFIQYITHKNIIFMSN